MAVTLTNTSTPTDPGGQAAYPDGFTQLLVSGVTVTATDTTASFTLPYIAAGAKAKLVTVITAVSGTSPTLQVDYFESTDGTNYNGTAALTSGAGLNAVGATWSSANSGAVFNQGHLKFTVGGTTPSFTLSVYLVVWNR